jgi:protein OS-9
MIIHTPRLCHDVAFLPPQENLAHPITCRAVIPESEVDAWTVKKLEGKVREAERLASLENDNPLRDMQEGAEGRTKKRPIIGGIEVGAHVLVGSEGKVIEKSVVAGGGKETYLGTIANSAGLQMSKEEMKKLQIQDPDEVEKWKNKLAKTAGKGKKWKLDLVDTPTGREFRWIVENEDEEEDAEKASSAGKAQEKGAGQGKTEPKREANDAQQEGSEEVYKDEL